MRLCGAPGDEDEEDDEATSTGSQHHHAHRTPAGNPLPDPVHLTVLSTDASLSDTDSSSSSSTIRWLNPRGRLVVAGDVHGCRSSLEALLREVGFERGRDNLVLTGDAVTKGPDSLGVIELAMKIGALCVRGNHDDLALAAADHHGDDEGRRRSPHRPHQPPAPPPPPPQPSPDFIPGLTDKHRQWLSSLPFTIRLPQYGATCVHAGAVPGVRRRAQSLSDLTRMRALVALPPRPSPGGGCGCRRRRGEVRWRAVDAHEPGSVPWAGEWRGPGHVFFGHDAPLGLQRRRGATGLDTGCVYGGRLTAAVLPSLEDLGVLRRRRQSWWRRALARWCGGGDKQEVAPLPRTPRFERDLHGTFVSVPSCLSGRR